MTNETENPGRNSDPQGRNETVVMCKHTVTQGKKGEKGSEG